MARTITITDPYGPTLVLDIPDPETVQIIAKGPQGPQGDTYLNPTWQIALGEDAVVGENLTNVLVAPAAGTILRAFAIAKTGPTGADLVFDLNVNGQSIWNSTQANRLKATDGATSGEQTSFDNATLEIGDELTIDIDQVGSGVAGGDITVQLLIQVS